MAKSKARREAATPRSERDLSRLLVIERLRGPLLPGVLIAVGVLVWVLSNVGLLETGLAILLLDGIALLLCLFFGLRDFIGDRTLGGRAAVLPAFAIVFAFAAFYPMVRTVFLPRAVVSGDLEPGGRPIAIPPSANGSAYRIVVDGHLPTLDDRSTQSAHYRLKVDGVGASPVFLEGDFSERWGTRRLGRRGTAPVHYARSSTHHDLEVASGEQPEIALETLAPATPHHVTIQVHPNPLSPALLIGMGVVATAGAMAIDAWRAADGSEGLMTSLTLGAILAAASFRRFAPAHPGLGDVIFNGAVGGAVGFGIGNLLWRLVRRPLRARLR